jgi:hypothetical protein
VKQKKISEQNEKIKPLKYDEKSKLGYSQASINEMKELLNLSQQEELVRSI